MGKGDKSLIHADGQQVVALAIVAVAAGSIVWRLTGQIRGFRSHPDRPNGSGCDGCGTGDEGARADSQPLVQIALRAPVRLRRPTDKS